MRACPFNRQRLTNNASAEIVGRLIRQAMFLTTFVSVLQLIESSLFLL